MFAKLTQAQATFLKTIRAMSDDDRRSLKRDIFAVVKDKFGIPAEHKVKVEVDNPYSPHYLTVIRKVDGAAYQLNSDGRWDGAVCAPTPAVRFFPVQSSSVADALADLVHDTDLDWDDGLNLDDIDGVVGTQPDLFGGHSYVVTSDARLYVARTESCF